MQKKQFTAIIEREDNMYVALCPELDIASQGQTVEEARNNLKEAIELFMKPPLNRRFVNACTTRFLSPA